MFEPKFGEGVVSAGSVNAGRLAANGIALVKLPLKSVIRMVWLIGIFAVVILCVEVDDLLGWMSFLEVDL